MTHRSTFNSFYFHLLSLWVELLHVKVITTVSVRHWILISCSLRIFKCCQRNLLLQLLLAIVFKFLLHFPNHFFSILVRVSFTLNFTSANSVCWMFLVELCKIAVLVVVARQFLDILQSNFHCIFLLRFRKVFAQKMLLKLKQIITLLIFSFAFRIINYRIILIFVQIAGCIVCLVFNFIKTSLSVVILQVSLVL